MYKQFTTDILHLQNFRLTHQGERVQNGWILDVEPYPQTHICPLCFQCSTNHERGKRRVLRHAWVSTGENIYLRIPVHRQRCDDCGITWTVEWPGIPARSKVTAHFKKMIARKCNGHTFEAVAKEMGVPPSTVAHWFYEYAREALARPENYEAPTALCMDEFAHKKGHHYSVALMDAHTGHVWQTHPGKSREAIQEALKQYPFEAPNVVATDLVPGMVNTIQEIWPETALVADKFHVIQLFTKALDRARKLDQHYATNHKEIRHQRRLLMTKPEKLKPDEKEILQEWLKQNEDLKKQYEALQDFRSIYENENVQQAKAELEAWCRYYLTEGAGATKKIVKTILQWKEPILNYFRFRLTNAKLEGTNNLIKTLKRRSFGCPNLEKFDMRIRMECQQPT